MESTQTFQAVTEAPAAANDRRRWIVLGVIGIARFCAVVNADSADDLILEPADLLAQPSPASTQRSDRPRGRRMAYAARQTPDVATQEIAA